MQALLVARHGLAEQGIAFTFSVGPGSVEEIAARVDGELQRIEALFVVRAAPAAHAPQSVGNVADIETSSAQLAVFHEGFSLSMSSVSLEGHSVKRHRSSFRLKLEMRPITANFLNAVFSMRAIEILRPTVRRPGVPIALDHKSCGGTDELRIP